MSDAGEPALDIAVVNYSFPVGTQTFHHRRQTAMAAMGVLHSLHHVRDADGSLEPSSQHLTALASKITTREVVAALPQLRRSEARTALIQGLRACSDGNGEGGRRGFLFQALCGLALGNRLANTQATNVHAVFATAPATIGVFSSIVASLPLSIEVHTPMTLATNPALLGFKLNRAASVFVISQYTKDRVAELVPDITSSIVHCGLDAASPVTDDEAEAFDVLAVGSLVAKKGHDVLIRAISIVQREDETIRLGIVGDGPDRQALERLASEMGADVTFLGSLPPQRVRALRSKSRVGVLASIRTAAGDEDGIPVALMEFMNEGIPTVGTDVAGIRELLDGGAAGGLVEPGNVDSLAASIQRALHDDAWRAEVTPVAQRRIAETFNNHHETTKLVGTLTRSARVDRE